jgi:hypothetical protein
MSASLIPAFIRSARVTLRVWWRLARQLFHEATGALFGVFAVYGLLAIWRQWTRRPILWVMGLVLVYAVVMALFSYGAFRRARRVR